MVAKNEKMTSGEASLNLQRRFSGSRATSKEPLPIRTSVAAMTLFLVGFSLFVVGLTVFGSESQSSIPFFAMGGICKYWECVSNSYRLDSRGLYILYHS